MIQVQAQINFPVVKNNLMYDRVEKCSDGMIRFQQNKLWGFLNKSGVEVIPAKFDAAKDFSNGFAPAKQGNKWGLIDKKGNWKVAAQYNELGAEVTYQLISFIDVLFGKNGVINTNGQVIIPTEFYTVKPTAKFIIATKRRSYGSSYDYFLYNHKGVKLVPEACDLIYEDSVSDIAAIQRGKKWSIIDANGKMLQDSLQNAEVKAIGFNLIILKDSKTATYGVCDKQGKMIVPYEKYSFINFNKDGFLMVTESKKAWGSTNNFYGMLDKSGKEIIPAKYKFLGSPTNGMVMLQDPDTKKYGFADYTGKIAVPLKYSDANHFHSSGFARVKEDGAVNFVYINRKGVVVDKNDQVLPVFNEGVAIEKNDSYLVIVNKKKNEKKVEGFADQWNIQEGLFLVKDKKGKYGFVDLTGKLIIPCQYDEAGFFKNGLAWVGKKGPYSYSSTYYGYITKTGEEILPGELSKVSDFSYGYAFVTDKNNKQYFINTKGEKQTLPRTYSEINQFKDGFALCKADATSKNENPTWYFLDTNLKEVKSFKQSDVNQFVNGFTFRYLGKALDYEILDTKFNTVGKINFRGIDSVNFISDSVFAFRDSATKKWGYKNYKSETTIAAQFDKITNFKNGFCAIPKDGKFGYIDKKGNWIITPQFEEANSFSADGYARVKKNGKYGIIDKTGKFLIEPNYNRLTDFEDGHAVYKVDNSYRILKMQ